MSARAVILGCAGPSLSDEERAFFRAADPWGFIVFKRNVETPEQVRALTSALRDAVGRDCLIFVDQEGGRVQRLGPPHWRPRPPGAAYGQLYAQDRDAGLDAARLGFRAVAHELRAVGLDADCMPILDVPRDGADPIIGDRALGLDSAAVAAVGRAVMEGLHLGGVASVIKHAPGHGRADVDSHLKLPVVSSSLEELEADLAPFADLADAPMAMTAHVVYAALDPDRPATTSPDVIAKLIRGRAGFDGLVMTDDLSMQALEGPMALRARNSIAAGCDMLLHCNGDMEEMAAVLTEAPELVGAAASRAQDAVDIARQTPDAFDPIEGEARLDALLEPVWRPAVA